MYDKGDSGQKKLNFWIFTEMRDGRNLYSVVIKPTFDHQSANNGWPSKARCTALLQIFLHCQDYVLNFNSRPFCFTVCFMQTWVEIPRIELPIFEGYLSDWCQESSKLLIPLRGTDLNQTRNTDLEDTSGHSQEHRWCGWCKYQSFCATVHCGAVVF